MSINLKKRMTTDSEQSFLRCAPLALRQEDLTTSDLCELQGGNGNSEDKLLGMLMTETGNNVANGQPTMPQGGPSPRSIDLHVSREDRWSIYSPIINPIVEDIKAINRAVNTVVIDVADWASEMWDLAQRPSSTPWNRGS